MEFIINRLKNQFSLSQESIDELVPLMEKLEYPKKHLLIKPDVICTSYYFIEQGLTREYLLHDGKDITHWFSKEGDITFSMQGAYLNQRGFEYVELLEDSIFYKVKVKDLNSLFLKNIELCNWSRLLHQRGFFNIEMRHIRLLTLDAKERYEIFRKENPELHNRINLGHLASFLGMNQVTLSRIRSSI